MKVRDVADYLLALSDPAEGDLMTNLKIQKLVYYAQGLHLALYNKPLFPDAIEAWMHGPVVPTLYETFKKYGSQAIPAPKMDMSKFNAEAREVLNEVYTVYGQFSAWRLREMTHDEPPWKNSYVDGTRNVISHAALRNYFKTQLVDG